MKRLLLVVLAAWCGAAAPETIYKYRAADGRITYSNKPLPGLEPIDTIELPASGSIAPPPREPSKAEADAAARVKKRSEELDKAWNEVQESGRALAAARERLLRDAEPREDEARGRVGESASPAVGGSATPAPPAAGGPMGERRGRGVSPEYQKRVEALEAQLRAAQARNDAAWRRYNELR